MKKQIILALGIFLSFAFNEKGPISHERTQTSKQSNAHVGRYLYLGEVPKFAGEDLEIYVSKLGLTTRVKARVTQDLIDNYAHNMFKRFVTIDHSFSDEKLSYHPLVNLESLGEGRSFNTQAWLKIASQYSTHALSKVNREVYQKIRNERNYTASEMDLYKNTISEAYFKFLFNVELSDLRKNNITLEQIISVENSRKLFDYHFKDVFTKELSQGYEGFLTFVYPIAATTKGPNDVPKQGVYDLKTAESIESRWWSDLWKDEFGGMPFLLVDWNGVAFHGPISNYNELDIWYLRRGYVSHGCHRMDASDIMEFRTLLPGNLKAAAKKIKIIVLDGMDIADIDLDGNKEVIDVEYYSIPSSVVANSQKSREDIIEKFSMEKQKYTFFSENKYAQKFYNKLDHTMSGVKEFSVNGMKLKNEKTHDNLGIKSFPYRKSKVIQYKEEGIKLRGFNDNSGTYHPNFFQQF